MTEVERSPGRLIVITGAQAAGRATVGYAVAARLPRAVHVDGDVVSAMVVSGGVPITLPAPPAAVEQLFLRWLASIAVAETYQQAGFDAVVTDTDIGDFLEDFLDFVSPAPLHLVMLDPPADEGAGRAAQWLDTSGQSLEETVNDILDRLPETAVETRA
ncbi:hypothetical protein [Lapillicoccus sp.]|uniref:hypothetical protein n=1 Tax=Lapillicoccus sp. TaxID=1909287 RepID=UPI00398379E9